MAIAKGTQVRQIVTPIEGTVTGFQVDAETGEVSILVEWEADGATHGKYFKESEIQPI